jgi:hypothetical protein
MGDPGDRAARATLLRSVLHNDRDAGSTLPPAKLLAKLHIRVALDSGLTAETPFRRLRARISLCAASAAGENRDRDGGHRFDRERELPV